MQASAHSILLKYNTFTIVTSHVLIAETDGQSMRLMMLIDVSQFI